MNNTKHPVHTIKRRKIGLDYPTYFIADIAANHDGSLDRAKKLICLAKDAGAEAAKFQHFTAEKIVSAYGFETMKDQKSHQGKWKKPVFQVYQEASLPWAWTPKLRTHCEKVGIHFFSAPYDLETIDKLDAYMPAYKIGSGDIDWFESLRCMAKKKKPVFLATGAATMTEVERAVKVILSCNKQLCLMQCNTNYTGSLENFKFINLNVLKSYAKKFPRVVLGLSDHTPGLATTLGAVALGARVIEKHFTDDQTRTGPDHAFAMDPTSWREMVDRTRELERALGDGVKRIEGNERETMLIQRRCCRAARELTPGTVLKLKDIHILRPAERSAFRPSQAPFLIGKTIKEFVPFGKALREEMLNP